MSEKRRQLRIVELGMNLDRLKERAVLLRDGAREMRELLKEIDHELDQLAEGASDD